MLQGSKCSEKHQKHLLNIPPNSMNLCVLLCCSFSILPRRQKEQTHHPQKAPWHPSSGRKATTCGPVVFFRASLPCSALLLPVGQAQAQLPLGLQGDAPKARPLKVELQQTLAFPGRSRRRDACENGVWVGASSPRRTRPEHRHWRRSVEAV